MPKQKTIIYSIFLSVLLCSITSPVFALSKSVTRYQFTKDDDFEKKHSIKKRALFKQALLTIEQKQYKKSSQLIAKLGDYPLVSYLEYKKLRKNLFRSKNKQVAHFLKKHKDTPYADKIRKKWLDQLAKKKYWKSYRFFYTPQKSTRRQCDYIHAQIQAGKIHQTKDKVNLLWLSKKSQPDSCDAVFKSWDKAGYISSQLRWQRIALAMKSGKVGLAKFLAKPLSVKDKKLLSLWNTLYRHPQRLLKSNIMYSKHFMQKEIISQIIQRQVRKNPQKSINLLSAVNKKIVLTDVQYQEIYRKIGLTLARKQKVGGWSWLEKIEDTQDNLYTQKWRIRAAIIEQNNKAIISSIDRLPKNEQKDQGWQFWQAKAQQNLGNELVANKIFDSLSKKRGYYGFLAADILDKPYNFEDKEIVFDPAELVKLKQNPAIQSAYEFLMLGKIIEAKREWYYITKTVFDDQQRILAAKLAQNWGWHDRAILTIAATGERNDMTLRFPMMFETTVDKYSKKNTLDSAYTYAVIRRESAFAVDARSPVGAMGLMQIMPSTAKGIAKKIKLSYRNKQQLHSGSYNVKMGTFYLQDMLKRFYDQPILASAAYNAGPHRVNKWLPKDKPVNAVDWVERIPFTETRRYVRAILAYTAIYEYRMGKTVTRLSQRMPDVPTKSSKRG